MSTTTFHSSLQRSRFSHHAVTALTSLLRAPLRFLQPALPRTAAEFAALEAQNVRKLASSYTKTDPGFAADLYAAAARHEGLNAD
jgi:hypothetical protein